MHFWYSEKQADRYRHSNMIFDDKTLKNMATINNNQVVYTVASKTNNHGCNWDDMEYIGEGEWHSCVGEW